MLRRPDRLEPLLDSLREIDRLVLLGDVVELRHGPMRDALAVARPVLEALGRALPNGAEVVIVFGNHDHHLLGRWLERRASDAVPPELGLESAVDCEGDDALATVASWLAPASVRAAYPGVWLRDDVYATHGHYLDRHTTVPMFERLGAGAMARIVREAPSGPTRAEDYERVLAPIYAWLHAIAQRGGPEYGASSHGASAQAWRALVGSDGRRSLRRRGLIAAYPLVVAGLNRGGIGPVRTDISGAELRRASLRAFTEVVARLHLSAGHVIFGHTHRAGPLPGDDPGEWRASTSSRLVNTGSWVHEPRFVGPHAAESPYRAGFAVLVEDSGEPVLTNLLDSVSSPAPA